MVKDRTSSRRACVALTAALVLRATASMAQQRPSVEIEDDVDVRATSAPRPAPASASTTTTASAPPDAASSAREDELRALRATLEQLQARLDRVERAQQAPPSAPQPVSTAVPPREPSAYERIGASPVWTTAVRPDAYSILDPVGVVLSGFVQAQHEWNQLSQDQLVQGVPLNRDRFVLRRARLRVDGSWPWFAFALEFDGNTVRGATAGIRRAEGSFVWRNAGNPQVPWLVVTAGVTEPAFGAELGEGVRRRWFMERSAGSLAFFGGEADVGVRAWGGAGVLRYALGVFNGAPLDDRGSALRGIDPSKGYDVSGRVGVDTADRARPWSVAAGVSFLAGSGFHAGEEATKPSVEWRDNNQNSMIDAGELVAIPGRAATPSYTFAHWALNADVALKFRTRAGQTRVFAEATMGTNFDRGAYASDPIATGYDLRQVQAVAGFTQEVTAYGILGFRWDYYNPNADLFEDRRGVIEPRDQGMHTFSTLAGVTFPNRARLVFQYDVVLDALARDARGVPTDLANNQATLRVQGDF